MPTMPAQDPINRTRMAASSAAAITAVDVRKSFDDNLDGVELTVDEGSVFALLGTDARARRPR